MGERKEPPGLEDGPGGSDLWYLILLIVASGILALVITSTGVGDLLDSL